MKKFIVPILLAIFSIVLLSSCGDKKNEPTPSPQAETPQIQQTPVRSPDNVPEPQTPTPDNSNNPHKDTEELKKEAAEVYGQFYNAVKHIENNPQWERFYKFYGTLYEDRHADRYVAYTGGTREEWLSKSPFERFIWYETYLHFMHIIYQGNYNFYFGSENNFLNNVCNIMTSALRSYGGMDAPEIEAYKEMMLWQYNYFLENGAVYNFITEQNSLEIKLG